MELFDFWAFQNFMKMLSHDKIIFQMLFWAFHITPRIHRVSVTMSQARRSNSSKRARTLRDSRVYYEVTLQPEYLIHKLYES